MGGTSSIRSDYRQAMLPLLLHPAPHRALFLGVGTGATLVGGSQDAGSERARVELSREVVDLLPWFANLRPPAPRSGSPSRTPPLCRRRHRSVRRDRCGSVSSGTRRQRRALHDRTFRRREKTTGPGGVFCQWLPLYQLDLPSLRAIIRGFLDIYPEGSAWLNHYSLRTPMLALIGRETAAISIPDALAARACAIRRSGRSRARSGSRLRLICSANISGVPAPSRVRRRKAPATPTIIPM